MKDINLFFFYTLSFAAGLFLYTAVMYIVYILFFSENEIEEEKPVRNKNDNKGETIDDMINEI